MNLWPVQTHASGKVVLLGEHAVLFGAKALCAALPLGVSVSACLGTGKIVFLEQQQSLDWNLLTHSPCFEPRLSDVLTLLQKMFDLDTSRFDFEISCALPWAGGLGSSAAISVAFVRCLNVVYNLHLTTEQLADVVHRCEQLFHGRASGIDHQIILQGGVGLFSITQGLVGLNIEPFHVCIGLSGQRKNTAICVEQVRTQYMKQPKKTQELLNAIDHEVSLATRALLKHDLITLGQCMNRNHEYLCTLGVSHERLNQLCALALNAGALGAKLTGAGRGGCVIALTTQTQAPHVLSTWNQHGFEGFITQLGFGNT